MRKIKWCLNTGFGGCDWEGEVEVDDKIDDGERKKCYTMAERGHMLCNPMVSL